MLKETDMLRRHREQMKEILHQGGVITLLEGQQITSIDGLPSEEELTADHAKRVKEMVAAQKHQERIESCDCWRITRPLDASDYLPNHLCRASQEAGMREWIAEYVSLLGEDNRGPIVMRFGSQFLHRNSVDDGRVRLYNKSLDVNAAGRVTTVIRQWVEEENDELKRKIDDLLPAIQDVQLNEISKKYMFAHNGYAAVDNFYPITPWIVEKFRANKLAAWGLPQTPGTARYCLWNVYRQSDRVDPPKSPTIGCLITSLGVEPTNPLSDAMGKHLYEIFGESLWEDKAAQEQVYKRVRAHRVFLEECYQKRKQANTFQRPIFTSPGRPPEKDEMAKDIERFINGEIQEDEVIKRARRRIMLFCETEYRNAKLEEEEKNTKTETMVKLEVKKAKERIRYHTNKSQK